MSDPLTDLITDIQHNGVRWVTVITVYAMFRKERRNHLLNRRDAANFANQREVMKALGVGDKWKDGPKFGFKTTDLPNLRRFFLLSRKDTIHQKRRMSMLTNILKANLSKKLISALVAIGVAALNQKFGLNLSENDITLILGLSLAHISLQTIIDSIKAWALSKSVAIVQQSVPIVQNVIEKAVLDPNTTYKDLFPTIKTVHDGINKIYADAQKNDASQAFRDAASAYLAIKDYIKSIEQPNPLPEIPSQQESA